MIKPLSQYELEILIQAIQEKEEFDIAQLDPNDFTWEITKALEDTYLPAVKFHPNDYLLYTIWLLIDRIDQKMKGFISFNVSPGNKKKVELSYTFFKAPEDPALISESLNTTLNWCKEKYNFEKFLLHGEYGADYKDVFLKHGYEATNNGLYNKTLSPE